MDLAQFLAARLDEDEDYLRVVIGSIGHQEAVANLAEPGPELRAALMAVMADPQLQALSERWKDSKVPPPNDLHRALREAEVKRAILALHLQLNASIWCSTCDPAGGSGDSAAWYPCATLRALAAVYSDHPDYQPEWKP